MTDNKIIRALECCIKPTSDCENCPYYKKEECFDMAKRDALNLIIRQQAKIEFAKTINALQMEELQEEQAEIERLKAGVNVDLENYASEYDSKIKAEAIKEFWSGLQGIAYQSSDWSHGEHPMVVELDDAEEIYKEMVGEQE